MAVSNMAMKKPTRSIGKAGLVLPFFFALVSGLFGQSTQAPNEGSQVAFSVEPVHQLISSGDLVVIKLTICNSSEVPVFVRRLSIDTPVEFRVIRPDGTEVPRRDRAQIGSKAVSPSDFAVLEPYHEISTERTISLQDGAGFALDEPGQYWVTAEYSAGDPGDLEPLAGGAKIPTKPFCSTKVAFCIETCNPLPSNATRSPASDKQSNISQTAIETVRVFYNYIVQYHPLGLPEGPAKRVLWPLLSKRLVQELTSLEACEDDYYRRYGEMLRKNQYKPGTPWLEEGLFSGPDETANPARFTILGSEPIGSNRIEVHLKFTFEDVYSGNHDDFDYEGLATVLLEDGRFVIDDFVTFYMNDELRRLSDGYPECKDGHWIGLPEGPESR